MRDCGRQEPSSRSTCDVMIGVQIADNTESCSVVVLEYRRTTWYRQYTNTRRLASSETYSVLYYQVQLYMLVQGWKNHMYKYCAYVQFLHSSTERLYNGLRIELLFTTCKCTTWYR
jgi:hypothetical protein